MAQAHGTGRDGCRATRASAPGVAAMLIVAFLGAACTSTVSTHRPDPRVTPVAAKTMDAPGKRAVKRHIGKPYRVGGRTYTPRDHKEYRATGLASWYGPGFYGRRTAGGETFTKTRITAAHPTLPLPSYVRVTNLANGHSLVVRVNDRGPFAHGRIIDLSSRAADLIGVKRSGVAKVEVELVDGTPSEGDDTSFLMASLTTGGGADAPSTTSLAFGGPDAGSVDATATAASIAAAAPLTTIAALVATDAAAPGLW